MSEYIKKFICPNACKANFYTTAHIMQEWEVDAEGDFVKVAIDLLQVSHEPDFDNIWVCVNCGEQGILIEGTNIDEESIYKKLAEGKSCT